MTFDTFYQSDEETWTDQQKDKDNDIWRTSSKSDSQEDLLWPDLTNIYYDSDHDIKRNTDYISDNNKI